ncbi:hypothetical protein Poli38472_000224 [Pythium oligandrum]|uniref:Ankyrin repeat protein n=1 Tax=Pythium oligandrum TaxID=41045 RepID=A0A8K1FHW5_PYTOL|nr:hypothetical protein Poli38472_000224 [Pythium oligandrum]|eukprot:TMW60182.1 hypothetical protein Poli38472_000224 [Pythium oligandrum]
MEEWIALDARLERKKRVKLRRQQREIKKQQKEREALEKEREKLQKRCQEMAKEEQLSIAMTAFYRSEEKRREREKQREEDMKVYGEVVKVRRRAKELNLSQSTPGIAGEERLKALQERVDAKEATLKKKADVRAKLEALPKKQSRLRRLMQSYFTSSLQKKVERAVFHLKCEELVELLDPKMPGRRSDATLLNHESKNGLTPALCAIFQKKLSVLRQLLLLGASPNAETTWGMTPLLATILTDDIVALSILVEFNVDTKYQTRGGVTGLLLAADKGRTEILKTLLRHGADVNEANADGVTPMIQAVISCQFKAATILLAFEARKDAVDKLNRTALDWAKELKADHIAAILSSAMTSAQLMAQLRDEEEETAGALNDLVMKKILLSRRSQLMETALDRKDLAKIRELLEAKDPSFGPNYETASGWTPLIVAARFGSTEDVLFCLRSGCITTHCNRFGMTALMHAAYYANPGILDVLLKAGLYLRTRDFNGNDTLWHFHINEHPDVAQQMVKTVLGNERNTAIPILKLGKPLSNSNIVMTRSAGIPDQLVSSSKETSDRDEINGASSRPSDGRSGGGRSGSSGVGSGDEDERSVDGSEDDMPRLWRVRQRVLHRDQQRRADYELDRVKILRNAQKGRRHGLVAPLPDDPKGRAKYPTCDNCKSSRARKRCFLCDQTLCDKCHARLHEIAHRRHHDYEELDPVMVIGNQDAALVVEEQATSLNGSIMRTKDCLQAITNVLVGTTDELNPLDNHPDQEVERYQRKKRLQREKEVMQAAIDVPVEAAKHANRAGEGEIYTNPSEIELADLYLTQKKFEKARTLMQATARTTEDALGFAHPTMLKIQLRIARADFFTGNFDNCIDLMKSVLTIISPRLPADSKDVIQAQDLTLDAMDKSMRNQDGVDYCHHFRQHRIVSLSASHPLVSAIQLRLDGFIMKRELFRMKDEDVLLLEERARSAEFTEKKRQEEERRLQDFCRLVLTDDPMTGDFMAYARREFAEDMVLFWAAVEKAKTIEDDPKAFRAAVVSIFLTYIKSRRIKIITVMQRKKIKKIITTPGTKLPRSVFDEVQPLVFDVIYHRVYARFLELV